MLDFTSSLYLGLAHGGHRLGCWRRLTAGAPSAPRPVPGERRLAAGLAALAGCEAAVAGPSTLHLFGGRFR